MRIAGGIAPSVSDAEEAVQDAFVKAYGALDRLRLGAPLAPWLMTIVSNEARNRRRSAGRREQLARRAAAEGRDEAPSPEVAAVSAAERAGLRAALARLGPTTARSSATATSSTSPRRRPPGCSACAAVR